MEHPKELKNCLSAAIGSTGLRFRDFYEDRGVDNLLRDAMLDNWSIVDLAVHALVRLTVGDKKDMDMATCAAVVEYLDRQLGVPPESRGDLERLRAIGQIVARENRTEATFRRWAESWYS